MGLTGYVLFDLFLWVMAGGIVACFVGLAIARVRECQIPADERAAEPGWWRK
jgi:hypothetical protein